MDYRQQTTQHMIPQTAGFFFISSQNRDQLKEAIKTFRIYFHVKTQKKEKKKTQRKRVFFFASFLNLCVRPPARMIIQAGMTGRTGLCVKSSQMLHVKNDGKELGVKATVSAGS